MSQFDASFGSSTGSLHRIRWAGAPTAVSPATEAGSLTAGPSPFSSRVSIAFALAHAGPVRVAIYDTEGRELRRLHDGAAVAGSTRLEWDGRDDRGRPLAAGLYFVRLDLAGTTRSARVLKMK